MSLYRKYRPESLADVVGQTAAVRILRRAFESGQISHAYLFCGPRGTGKTSLARIVARQLIAGSAEFTPAMAVDLLEIDAASNRGIDEIRELRETIAFAPSTGAAKVYIIDEVHMLTKEAFNALLKTLEEPPAHAYFILATTEAHKVPETIISRCQRFDFQRISTADIAGRLAFVCSQESISADPEALELIAEQSDGGMRDALSLLEQMAAGGQITVDRVTEMLGLARPQAILDFVAALLARDAAAGLDIISRAVAEGMSLPQFARQALARLRERMLAAIAANSADLPAILAAIDRLTVAAQALKSAIIPQLPLEVAVVEIARPELIAAPVPAAPANPAPILSAPVSAPVQPVKSAPIQNHKPAPAQPAAVPIQPSPAPQAPAAAPAGEISQAAVAAALPLAIASLKASVKLSAKQASLAGVEKGTAVFAVPSSFYLEKLDEPLARREFETALSAQLGRAIAIRFQLDAGGVRVPADEPAPVPAKPAAKSGDAKADLLAEAERLFGQDDSF